jgi:Holliday junction DNA helicase RuvA
MIAYLRGIVRHLDEVKVVLDVGGVGYEVLLPSVEAKALRTRLHRDADGGPVEGRETDLWIYYHVAERQPRPLLIGFQEQANREFFELLLSVAEVGPTIAARSMTIAVCDYAGAIERRDVRTLGTLPGIGKRKADQIVASLKGKALKFAMLPPPEIDEEAGAAPEDFVADVESVLQGLGYKPGDATRMVDAARKRKPELADFQSLMEEIFQGKETP